jgi:hypothetical protein
MRSASSRVQDADYPLTRRLRPEPRTPATHPQEAEPQRPRGGARSDKAQNGYKFEALASKDELPADFGLDGEAVAHCSQGLPEFHGLLGRDGQRTACLYAFDLLHLRVTDLRPAELVGRRAMLKKLIRRAGPVLIFSEHMDAADGEPMFRHACARGLEGIVRNASTSPTARDSEARRIAAAARSAAAAATAAGSRPCRCGRLPAGSSSACRLPRARR